MDYKHTRIKQYHKQGRALRTETTINDTRDFSIGKRLTNLPALREIGFSANRRLLHVQRLGHDPITGTDALHAITDARHHRHRRPRPGPAPSRPAQPRPAVGTAGVSLPAQRLHQLRPARAHRRAARARPRRRHRRPDHLRPAPAQTPWPDHPHPRTHRYPVTDHGLDTAKFLTTVHDRFLRTGLAELAAPEPTPGRLKAAATAYRKAVDTLTATTQFAA